MRETNTDIELVSAVRDNLVVIGRYEKQVEHLRKLVERLETARGVRGRRISINTDEFMEVSGSTAGLGKAVETEVLPAEAFHAARNSSLMETVPDSTASIAASISYYAGGSTKGMGKADLIAAVRRATAGTSGTDSVYASLVNASNPVGPQEVQVESSGSSSTSGSGLSDVEGNARKLEKESAPDLRARSETG